MTDNEGVEKLRPSIKLNKCNMHRRLCPNVVSLPAAK